jgi:serine/threonine-protein kinase RsbT
MVTRVATEQTLPIAGEDDIVAARQRVRDLARSLGFGMLDQSRIATAVSELTRNVVRYATDSCGSVQIRALGDAPQAGVEVVVSDSGPGIADIELVMREGFTSGQGLGMGLPGTKRLVDEMEIVSALGQGTVVTIRKWRR